MSYTDLRQFINAVDQAGELTRLDNVNWDGEVGAICFMSSNAVLMDKFAGYPAGFRTLVNMVGGSGQRFSLATGWSAEGKGLALTKAWKEHLKEFKSVPVKWVSDGPIMENVAIGKDVNLWKFPVPKLHEEDGGRYLGTEGIQILKDPETGRINFGMFRMQVHDKATLGIHISEGKDSYIIKDKYLRQGNPCPIVAVFGIYPSLYLAAGAHMTHQDGLTEFDYSGWLKGSPEEVIKGQFTGLPIPARAEIAIEGEIPPGDMAMEGPFGEGTGYSEPRNLPVVRVKGLYHRNDPIITARPPQYHPPGKGELPQEFQKAALIWDQLEKAGVREIKGVGCFFGHHLTVVSIRNSYAGHSRQAGLIASQCHAGNYLGNWVIVVDEEIDPTVLNDVIWATVTRTDAKRAIQVLDYCWSSHMSQIDPSRFAFSAGYPIMPLKATYKTAAVIDACRPVEWDPSWHRLVIPSAELQNRVLQKWGSLLKLKKAN
ncbi:MAG: UbiD family decarboxylase [Chloroflexi bacterium]|nr:UbiD family decarboxylase [Chloroflexota bacterium]